MKQNFHRRSIRLQGYDYSQDGLYFLTICTQNKEWYFGEVKNHKMILSEIGRVVEICWNDIPNHFPQIILHEYVIMPNHIHGIIEIHNTETDGNISAGAMGQIITETDGHNDGAVGRGFVGANNHSPLPTTTVVPTPTIAPTFPHPTGTSRTIGSVVRGFKIGTTRQVGFSPWQRNYYEHIIRHDVAYQHIAQYINQNPAKWHDDRFYTNNP